MTQTNNNCLCYCHDGLIGEKHNPDNCPNCHSVEAKECEHTSWNESRGDISGIAGEYVVERRFCEKCNTQLVAPTPKKDYGAEIGSILADFEEDHDEVKATKNIFQAIQDSREECRKLAENYKDKMVELEIAQAVSAERERIHSYLEEYLNDFEPDALQEVANIVFDRELKTTS